MPISRSCYSGIVPPIINVQGLSKTYGIAPLFQNISFIVEDGARIGLIGPNGSGKSTLLQILEGRVKPDAGEVAIRKRTRMQYVAQYSEFPPGATVRSVVEPATAPDHCDCNSAKLPDETFWGHRIPPLLADVGPI